MVVSNFKSPVPKKENPGEINLLGKSLIKNRIIHILI